MTFHSRMSAAKEHEANVLAWLRERGWSAEPFGQGQLTDEMRTYLRQIPKTCVRWMADIIAAKNFAARTLVIYIDAKAGTKYRQTGNHDIELSALESAERWIDFTGEQSPYYYVFADGGVATPAMVRELSHVGTFRGSGSGTDFVLFPVSACRPFDSVFGFTNRVAS